MCALSFSLLFHDIEHFIASLFLIYITNQIYSLRKEVFLFSFVFEKGSVFIRIDSNYKLELEKLDQVSGVKSCFQRDRFPCSETFSTVG